MGKKSWYIRGVQTQLLLILLCLAQQVLAKPTAAVSAKKNRTNTTAHTVHSPQKSTPDKTTTKNTSAREVKSTPAKSSTPSATTTKTKSEKEQRSARVVSSKITGKESTKKAKPLKPSSSLTMQSGKRTIAKAKFRSHSSASSRTQTRSVHTKSVRVLAVKETKRHTLVKTVVIVPATRSTARSIPQPLYSSAKSKAFARTKSKVHIASSRAVYNTAVRLSPPSLDAEAQHQSASLPARNPSELREAANLENPPVTLQKERGSATKSEAFLLSTKTEPAQGHRAWAGYTSEKAGFAIKFNEERLLYRINSAFVLPGDEIFLDVSESRKKGDYTLRSALGTARQLGSARWYWQAPQEVGLYPVKVTNQRSGDSVLLHIFVMVRHERIDGGYLNGYRIGTYPSVALRQLPIYNRPRGFIEVTAANEDTLVSPHFRLGQFLCKQDGEYPKYMVLDSHLLTALELLLEKVNARGYHCLTFCVMSGYRTPYYNRAIGNSTTYSRHLWGDAADIFIDENPRDGVIDDLNQDGSIDSQDAAVLYDLVDDEYEPQFQQLLTGGLARYRETASHGPFVHVDVRGLYTRWGVRTTLKGLTPSVTHPIALQNRGLPQAPRPSFWEPETTEPAP